MISSIFASLPPAVILIIGGLLMPFLHRYVRYGFAVLIPVLTLVQVWNIPVGVDMLNISVAGFDLRPVYAHPYTHIFATIFAIASFAGALFGLGQSKISETAAAFIYAGGAIGVTFSGDFISLFMYWELMAIGSTMIIFASGHEGVMRSGMRYAMVHFLGGVILMSGIVAHIILTGDASLVHFDANMAILFPKYGFDMNAIVIWLILIGVLINAAAPPMSAWIADSYPRSSAFGAVFLSAFTTKTAVFVLITIFAGTELLIYIGLFMIFYGIIYAMLENDMRRILAYSIVNQVGFMVVGIGIGTELALNGAAAHAFAHIIYKALLFMSAGSVLYMTGKSKCTELGGLYKSMKLTAVCSIIGALSISAFPLTSSFVTKSMIASAAMHEELQLTWFLLLAASAGVFLYAGIIKMPWFVFFQKDSGLRPKDPPINMQLAMVFFALLCIIPAIPGVAEVTIYKMLPTVVDYKSYTNEHVISQLQLLLFSGLAFFVMLPMLKRTETVSLDFDWFYRVFGRYVVLVVALLARLPLRIARIVVKKAIRRLLKAVYYIHNPDGVLARSWSLDVTVIWTIALLGVYVIIYYL